MRRRFFQRGAGVSPASISLRTTRGGRRDACAPLRRPRYLGVGCALTILVGTLAASSQEEPKLPPEAEKIGEDLYRIGKVKADLKAKTVTCTGTVNMHKGLIEYLAVAPEGKRHESLLTLDLRPLHLQVGLILLGLEPKGGLRYQGDKQIPKGSPVDVYVSWQRGGRTVKVAATDLVWDTLKKRPMERNAWVFSGSGVSDKGFLADLELSLIATFRDPAAIVNNALPSGADDTVYKVNERIVPPLDTPVTVMLTPRTGGA